MSSVYHINKGINKSIEFKGLKAQYIWFLGGLIISLLVLFALLYILGLNAVFCMSVIGFIGIVGVNRIYRLSNTYGEYGMMKKAARRKIPKALKIYNRNLYHWSTKKFEKKVH